MNLYIRSDQPFTLQRLLYPWRQMIQGIPQNEDVAGNRESEELVHRILQKGQKYQHTTDKSFWQKELHALQEIAKHSFAIKGTISMSPLLLSHHIPSQCLPLVEGMYVKEWLTEVEPFSALAFLWLREIGVVSTSSTPGFVHQVAVGEGVAILGITPKIETNHVMEQTNHGDEHIDEGMLLLQVNVDDSTPEWLAYTMESLFQAGANDVTMFPMTMKKSRAGVMVQVMCYQSQLPIMENILLKETTTFGVRYFPVSCHRLARRFYTVNTTWGEVPVKVGYLRGERVQVSPEYDVCAKLARKGSITLKSVYQEAIELGMQIAPLQW